MQSREEVRKTFIISAESEELLIDTTYSLKKEYGEKVTQGRLLDTAIKYMIKNKSLQEILNILGSELK